MADKRTKRAILAELDLVKRQNTELTQQMKDHFGKDAVVLTADVNRLAEVNRQQAEELRLAKQRTINEEENVKTLTAGIVKQGRQLIVLKGIIDFDHINVENLIDRILENA